MKVKANDENGSVLLFGIGLGIVTLMILTSAINVATLWVTRTKLDSVADATALAATKSIDVSRIYQDGITQPVRLNQTLAKQRAMSYLNQLAISSELSNFQLLDLDVSNNEVDLLISAEADMPFGYLLPGLDRTVKSRAKAALQVH